jgi:arylsulfatase A-like enzyme
MDDRPNVLMIHCHDLGRFLHCYGFEAVHTPQLDAFASRGVLFERCFCTAPQCSPSRASLFTGRYPHANGVMGLCHGGFQWDLNPDEIHMARILKDSGYSTYAAGIVHETGSAPGDLGYEEHAPGALAESVADATIDRLNKVAGQERPFFIAAGFLEPHRLPGPDPEADFTFLGSHIQAENPEQVDLPGFLRDTPGSRQEVAELQAAVRHVDTQFGRILKALHDLNLQDNTLVIFTTDHGYALPRAKCSLYDPGIGVALIMRLPFRKEFSGGRQENLLMSNVDVLPTLLDLLDIERPFRIQGISMVPALEGRSLPPREEIFAEITWHDYYDPRRCIRTEDHKLILNFSTAPAFMDPSQSWRPRSDVAVPANRALSYTKPVELYDLNEDPWELNNLASEQPLVAIRGELTGRLRLFLEQTADPVLRGAVTPPRHYQVLDLLNIS